MRADILLVAARTGSKGSQGISLFAVPGNAAGLSRKPLDKTGWLCSDTAEIAFDDVRLPADALLGEENKGWRLDHFLAKALPELSRSRLQGLIARGLVEIVAIARDQGFEPLGPPRQRGKP